MSLYNTLIATVRCPHCQRTSTIEMQVWFGLKNFIEYRVGDPVQWLPRKAVRNGGRPPNGDLISDAYGICPVCDRDFFVPVEVKNDHILQILQDQARGGYDADH